MYQRWLNFLELLGRIRLPRWRSRFRLLPTGRADGSDVLDSTRWKQFCSPETLFRAWGPDSSSVWKPYHCITLFAALEKFSSENLGPLPRSSLQFDIPHTDPAPPWAKSKPMVIIDLPGPESVMTATWLAFSAGYQPVSTFDNWPHPAGLLKPESTIGALLYFAPLMADLHEKHPADAPPMWICERGRLGIRSGRPKEFDNRYYLDDSILPGPNTIKQAGIKELVYICPKKSDPEIIDLSLYFQELRKQGIRVLKAPISDAAIFAVPTDLVPQQVILSKRGFFRSSAGGFGIPIPEPSSSSG